MRRRRFLQDSLKVAAGAILAPVVAPSVFKETDSSLMQAAELVRRGFIGAPDVIRIGIPDVALIRSGDKYFRYAAWGTETEYTEPLYAEAVSDKNPGSGKFMARVDYGSGLTFLIGSAYSEGIRFEGSEGWITVSKGKVEAGDPGILKSIITQGSIPARLRFGVENNISDIIHSVLPVGTNNKLASSIT